MSKGGPNNYLSDKPFIAISYTFNMGTWVLMQYVFCIHMDAQFISKHTLSKVQVMVVILEGRMWIWTHVYVCAFTWVTLYISHPSNASSNNQLLREGYFKEKKVCTGYHMEHRCAHGAMTCMISSEKCTRRPYMQQ